MADKPMKSDWEKLAAKESRGKDLTRETVEGIRLSTAYGPDDTAEKVTLSNGTSWKPCLAPSQPTNRP